MLISLVFMCVQCELIRDIFHFVQQSDWHGTDSFELMSVNIVDGNVKATSYFLTCS